MFEQQRAQWEQQRLTHWLTEGSAKGLGDVLRSMVPEAGLDFEIQAGTPEVWNEWREPLWFTLPSDLAEGADLAFGCVTETARGLAALVTGETDVSEEIVRETYLELLNQTASSLGATASENIGRSVQFSQASDSSHPSDPELGVEFRFQLADATHLLAVVPSQALLGTIFPSEEGSASATVDDVAADFQSPVAADDAAQVSQGGGAAPGAPPKGNLELLLEVELDLSVSFGSTLLPVQDVLKLASGSIVELNRSAADPVDVLVNNSVIARGEVVVVDGNYGIRVTEIVSRKERIRSIF